MWGLRKRFRVEDVCTICMRTSQNQGYLFGGLQNTDFNILGSTLLGFPDFVCETTACAHTNVGRCMCMCIFFMQIADKTDNTTGSEMPEKINMSAVGKSSQKLIKKVTNATITCNYQAAVFLLLVPSTLNPKSYQVRNFFYHMDPGGVGRKRRAGCTWPSTSPAPCMSLR